MSCYIENLMVFKNDVFWFMIMDQKSHPHPQTQRHLVHLYKVDIRVG